MPSFLHTAPAHLPTSCPPISCRHSSRDGSRYFGTPGIGRFLEGGQIRIGVADPHARRTEAGKARAGRRGVAGQVGRRQQRGQPVSVDSLGGIYQGHVLGGRVHGRVWAVVARVDIEPAGRRDFARRTPDGARPEPPSSLLVGHQVVTSRGGASSEPKAQACPSGSSMPSTRGGRRSSSSEATRRAMTDSMRNTSPWPTLSMKSILNN